MLKDEKHCTQRGNIMITVRHEGNFENTTSFLNRMQNRNHRSILEKYAKQGVEALSSATPVKTGKTAQSWSYEIVYKDGRYEIHWTNSNINNGVNIALILQYGHGTRRGGYVKGIDYINPALRQTFDAMTNELWGEVTR